MFICLWIPTKTSASVSDQTSIKISIFAIFIMWFPWIPWAERFRNNFWFFTINLSAKNHKVTCSHMFQLTHEVSIIVLSKNLIQTLCVIVEAERYVVIWRSFGNVWSLNERRQVSYAKIFRVSGSTCCVWMIQELNWFFWSRNFLSSSNLIQLTRPSPNFCVKSGNLLMGYANLDVLIDGGAYDKTANCSSCLDSQGPIALSLIQNVSSNQ
jgi:hypothetical protein